MRHIRSLSALMILFAVVGCDRGPSVQSSITAGQKHFQPVLDALAKYHEKHARYPAKLDELVREGLLSEIPKTPAVENARPGGPYYRVDDERKSYEFIFSYHLHDQGIGVGDTTYAKWHSASGSWSMSGPGY